MRLSSCRLLTSFSMKQFILQVLQLLTNWCFSQLITWDCVVDNAIYYEISGTHPFMMKNTFFIINGCQYSIKVDFQQHIMIVNAHIGLPFGCEALNFDAENPKIQIAGIIGNIKRNCEKKRKPKTISTSIMVWRQQFRPCLTTPAGFLQKKIYISF